MIIRSTLGFGLLFALMFAIMSSGGSAQPAGPDSDVFATIVTCLGEGKEVVMAPRAACVDRQTGEPLAERAGMPLGTHDWAAVCKNPQDARRLPADIVKRIAKSTNIAPSGIRIIGAVFCNGIDLAGLDLPYSLVLDRSIFLDTFDARNLRIKGDLSFEYTVILDNFRLNRAQVEGSVYGGASFMNGLRAFDTQVTGSWEQKKSFVLGDAQIVRVTIAGDLNLNSAMFSRLWLQSSHIKGVLELDESEARCAYHLNSSDLGYLTANHTGFGIIATTADEKSTDYRWWTRHIQGRPRPYTQDIYESPAVQELVAKELARIAALGASDASDPGRRRLRGCELATNSEYLEFFVFDTTVRTTFCLTSFVWPVPKHRIPDITHPVTILALNGTRIEGNFIVDLWGDAQTDLARLQPQDPGYGVARSKHKFEAVGLTAMAAIYDFSDNARPYFTYLDGLKFERVHKAQPACTNTSGTKLKSQVELPSVDDVLQWLSKNESPSSQPFNTFVQAFERAGANATALRIARKNIDLCKRTTRLLQNFGSSAPSLAFFCPSSGVDAAGAVPQTAEPAFFSRAADMVGTGFELVLWAVADHGYRPGKVIGPILTVMLLFWFLFWIGLGIVAFDPKVGDQKRAPGECAPWPISFLFLFDRMIPLYNIRKEHYAIVRYYRRAGGKPAEPGDQAGPASFPMKWCGFTILVRPLDEAETQRAENWLTILRILGAGLTVFLLAAISALAR